MALDPLKFKIAIEHRELEEELKKARNTLVNGLKDVPIHLKIENLQELQNQVQKIGEKLSGSGSGGSKSSGTTAASKAFETLKSAVDAANKSFESDSELKNYMKNMEALNVAIGKMRKSLAELRQAETLASMSGNDTSKIQARMAETRERIQQLRELRKNVDIMTKSDALTTPQGIGQSAAVWREFSQFLSGNNSLVQKTKTFADNADMVKKAIDKIAESMQKLHNTNAIGFNEYGKRNPLAASALAEARAWKDNAERVNIQDSNAVRQLIADYNKLAETMKKAQAEQDALNRAGQREKITAENARAKELKEQETAAENATKAITRLEGMYTRLENTANQSGAFSTNSAARLREITEWINKANNTDFGDKAAVRLLMQDYYRLRDAIRDTQKEQEKLNRETERNKARQQSADLKEANRIAEQAQKATVEITKLEIELRKLSETSAKGKALGIDTSNLDAEIGRLQMYLNVLKQIRNGVRTDDFKSIFGAGYDSTRAVAKDESQRLTKAINEEEQAKKRAAQATQQLTAEEQKLAQAIQQSISQMNHQSQVLNDLKSMAMQYLSVYAGQQFLNNIIEIGGQLEMQRLSIGAILQDTAHANDLFEQIKGLALQSPFGVVELDQFTKQLSAYGFKYNELFDMTKRLADISAGAGTDVSRLALALGHVRAEGALTGYTLRQFAMNNIPMLGKLSEKLSELEGKIVTAGDVRKRVRNKEIDYDMVESVIKDLTNEGGMFYNMQEVISGSVKAKWKNLHDAFDIMFGEMAESGVGGALKDVATTLTKLAKSWKEIGTVVMSVVGVYAGAKVAMLAYNALLGRQTVAVLSSISAERQAEISKLRLAQSYRYLTAAEKATLLSTNRLTAAELKTAISSKALTAEQLSKAVAMGKVSKATALAAVRHSTLDAVEKQQIRTTILNTQVLGLWGKAMYGVRAAVLATGAALKTLLANPITWILAFVSGVTYLWQKNNEEMEQAAELSKKLAERSAEGIKNVRTMMKETDMKFTQNGVDISASFGNYIKGGEFKWKPAAEMDTAGMIQTMERWTDFINQYAATPNTLLGDAWRDASGKVRDLADQYEHLAQAVAMVAEAQVDAGRLSEAVEYALGKTDGGWFNENLVTNLNDYAKRMKTFNNTLTDVGRSYPKVITAALNAAKTDAKFAKAITEANDVMLKKEGRNLTEIEQLKRLYDGQVNYNDAFNKFKAVANQESGREDFTKHTGLAQDYRFMANAKAEAERDMQTFADSMKAKMKEMGWDLENLTGSQKQAILYAIKDVVGQSADSTEELKKMWESIAATYFGIKIDADTYEAVAKTNELEKDLDKLVNGDWVIDIKAVSNFSDLLTKIRQDYKTAQDYFNNVKPFMIKFGVSMVGGMKKLTKEQRDTIIANWKKANPGGNLEMVTMLLDQWDKLAEIMGNALDFSTSTGLSLSDPNPGGKVFRDKKGKSSKDKKGSDKDEQAKGWRERIRQLKDARQWYEKWEKEIGNTAALEKVKEIFHGLVDKKDVETLEALENAIKGIKAQAESRKAKNKGKDERADEIIRQADDELAQIDMQKFQEDSETALGKMDKYLEKVSRHWETFNSVLEATGDRLLAMKLAGFDEYDSNFASSSADALMNRLEMEMMLPDLQQKLINAGIMEMSDKEIDKYIKNWLGGTEYKRYIDALTKGVKEWKKMEQSYIKESIQDYAKLIGSAVDYQTQVDKINAEYVKTREHLTKLLELGQEKKEGGITKEQYDQALELARIMRDDKTLKLSSTYLNLLNRANALSRNEMTSAIEIAISNLDNKLSHGLITLEDYTEELAKLKKIAEDWEENTFFGENNALTNFIQGGAPGLKKWLEERRDRFYASGEDDEAKTYQGYIDKLNKVTNLIGDLAIVVELVTGALDGMQKATTALANMYEALGMQGSANRWNDISSGIGAVSSFFNPVSSVLQNAQSGNVGGLLSSVISAPFEMVTSPIKGFAELHDRKRERAIEEIKKDVQRISNTLSLIQTGRGRTLGYDDGYYRRMMASLYANSTGSTGKGMLEYYTRGGNGGNGYEQELAALKAQREDYLRMYDKEKEKKNESTEALEEYKVKMAELDDKIMYYTEDLAKELWSVDLKGWADQIGDALMNAFENGTSAALAFKDATQNILRSVVNEMLKVGIIQPMMESLREKLFGENGAFNYSDPQGSMGKVLAELGRFFGEGGEGQMMMVAGQEFLTGAEQLLNENFGMTLKGGSSQSTQTSGIQSQATEESIGIVSGQLARIAQDVSVKRIFITQFVTDQMPKMLENAQLQRTLLESQFQSVRAIEHMMSDGNGAMFDSIDRMSRKIDRAITPDGKMRIE